MARRGGEGGMGGGGGMMAPILGIATGLLVFIVLIIFAPTIAGSIQAAQPDQEVDSAWNSTFNPDVPNGVDVWTTNIQILGVVILIITVSVGLYYLKGI